MLGVRRVACIALPQIRVEIVRGDPAWSEPASSPLAVVIVRSGSSVKTERDVLGNTRLDVVSKEARAHGVRVGQTVAAARAKCAGLRVRVLAESVVRAALARVAEVALAFGPSASFDAVRDVVWLEIGGCAHLDGGEHELVQKLDERVCASGHVCRVAIADGPRIASAVARLTPVQSKTPLIVPPGRGASAIRSLSVEALDLAPETVVWLKDLGLRTCGELQSLPKRSLGTRLGARAVDVMQLLNGEDGAPLDAWRPPEVPEERVELEWGTASVEALGFIVRALCDRLSLRLEGRAMAASRIGLVLALDRALLGEGASPTSSFELVLPVPIVRATDLFAVVRARLEHLELPAPALAVTLRALELSPAKMRPLELLTPEPKAASALGPLVAELGADLGPENVGTLALVDTWSPDERTRLVPFATSSGLGASRELAGAAPMEPSRLVNPLRRPLDSLAEAVLLTRFEAVEWWRRGLERRDFYAAWDGANLAWLEVRSHARLSTAPSSTSPRSESWAASSAASRAASSVAAGSESGVERDEAWLCGWID